jgi:hypothetical protein
VTRCRRCARSFEADDHGGREDQLRTADCKKAFDAHGACRPRASRSPEGSQWRHRSGAASSRSGTA